jgi:hypothetical protein
MRASASILQSMEASLVATEIEILSVLKILGDVYPTHRLSSAAIEVYVRLLADIPGMLLEQAALDHISRSTFFPAIAELRSAAFNIIEAVDPIPSGFEAWAEVQSEIRRVGHCGNPQFANPITAQVVELFGWRYLCLSENPVADRAHFVQAYHDLATHRRDAAHRLTIVTQFITGLQAGDHPQLAGGESQAE